MNELFRLSRLLTRTVPLLAFLTVFPRYSAAQGPQAVVTDSVAVADSSVASPDSTSAAGVEPLDPLVRFRSRSTLSLLFTDTLLSRPIRPQAFSLAFPFYLDDALRLAPSMVSGDSLGNGYPRRFSPLGAGFAATGVFLDGMQLADPLSERVDWRLVPVEIVAQGAVISGGAHSGVAGWSDEVHLFTHYPSVPSAVSRMGISGGAYEINKVGGGVRRSVFGTGAVHVQINKIQQSTEDFAVRVENIQYYTRFQQQLSPGALLAVDGLFFSDDFRR
ncbi:MAG: Plug domain-containing protein, partial [Candidatus Glassbacteria bacterium]|nr:Plug domain-containing protein [Candidatus Glassbacteria bacterium]